MSSTRYKIFVSSVQGELAEERRAVKDFILNDPLLGRFFEVFLFEDLPAQDRRADAVYLEEVSRCDIYMGIFGNEYGSENPAGVSPTELEFNEATAKGKPRLIFVKGANDKKRHPKMLKFIGKAGAQLIRKRFTDTSGLTVALYSSLVNYLEGCGIIQARHVEDRPCPDATLSDIDGQAVASFVGLARLERQFPLLVKTPVADVLSHLNLLCGDRPSIAAILLFGRNPQRFLPASEVRCMHFHGTEIARPVPFYRIFKGALVEQVDMAVDFVMSKINRSVGTRSESVQAPVRYEIPHEVIREAIVNAVAHRDYTSAGAVQVSVFADRVEVWNPGTLIPPLTPESLREPHGSIARNPRICEVLFLARYIEKYGTGTLMMIRESLAHSLPEPDFVQRGGEFTSTIWRDWLTEEVTSGFGLNERQQKALAYLKAHGRITNKDYQQLTGVTDRTVLREFKELIAKGVLERVGETGRGTHYVLKYKTRHKPDKPDMPWRNVETRHKPDKQDISHQTEKDIPKRKRKGS
jgi:predicted HTH transcriptional regulator